CLSLFLRDTVIANGPRKEFRQPSTCFSAEMDEELRVHVVIPWSFASLQMLEGVLNLNRGEIWHWTTFVFLTEAAPISSDPSFVPLVPGCLGYFNQVTSDSVGSDWWVRHSWGTLCSPQWRMRPQLFRLDRVKSSSEVHSSHRCRLAAFSESIRWSATSGSPDSSNCFSRAALSESIQGIYVGRNPLGMDDWAALKSAPVKRL